MGQEINRLVVGIATIYCAYWLVGAIRNGYFRGSRRYGHRKIHREKQPRLYWFNVILMTIFFFLGLFFMGWGLIPHGTFH